MTQPEAARDDSAAGADAPEQPAASGVPTPPPVGPASPNLKGPGFPLEDDEVTCPSCGRFAGTYERCPYCGAGMRVRLSIRVLRRLSLVVGILGVALITWAARNMEIPRGNIGDFTATQNFAILQVHGKIVSGPYYGDRGDSFYVGVDDGTGRLNAKAYGTTAVALKALDLKQGDRVAVQGSVRIQAGKAPSMSLRVKGDLEVLERSAPTAPAPSTEVMKIGEISRELAAERVKARVRGTVKKAWANRSGRGAELDDGTGSLSIWIYERELERMGEGPEFLTEGAVVEVVGPLDVYRRKGSDAETVQLRPYANAGGLVVIEKAPAKPVAPAASPRPRTPKPAPKAAPGGVAPAIPVAPGIDEVGSPAPGFGGPAPTPVASPAESSPPPPPEAPAAPEASTAPEVPATVEATTPEGAPPVPPASPQTTGEAGP